VSHEASDPRSSATGGATEPGVPPNGSSAPEEGTAAQPGDEDELAERIDLPLDSLLDWGADPRDADPDLETRTEEALVAAERDEYLDALRRLQADFDNFRKRSMRQQTELLERATEGLCVRLLPVLDALDLAIDHVRSQNETSDAAKALEQIGSLLRDILAREGVERIDAVGVPFDPTVHDAVGHLPADEPASGAASTGPSQVKKTKGAGAGAPGETTASAGIGKSTGTGRSDETSEPDEAGEAEGTGGTDDGPTVAQVMRAGYRLKSKVLRPAMVVVKG